MEPREPNGLPFVGHSFEVNFGTIVFQNTFESENRLTYWPIQGGLGRTQTVSYKSLEIDAQAYFQFWQEEDQTTVTRYVDFAKHIVYATITLPDHSFLTLQGTLKPIQ